MKAAADEHHMPYQRLIKTWLEEGLARNEPERVPKPVHLRLTADQLRIPQSGGSFQGITGSPTKRRVTANGAGASAQGR